MLEFLKAAGEYGITLIIAAAFVWDKISHSKIIENILKEVQSYTKMQTSMIEALRDESLNRTTVLNVMQKDIDNIIHMLERDDKRSEHMNSDIREMRTLLNNKPCINEKRDDILT